MSSAPPPPGAQASPASAAAAQLATWLEVLPAEQRDALARRYAAATASAGATILKPDGRVIPIPPLLTPEILDRQQLAAVERNAHAITQGLSRLTTWLMSDRGAPLRARLFRAFGPLEQLALEQAWRDAEHLATVRVDYLIDEGGAAHALEVNSTIPAMQGYSDLVADAFLVEVGRERGAPATLAEALADDNGRNTDQLLTSLLAHHRALGGPLDDRPRRIAIVARPGDSQLGELRHLTARFTALGHPTSLLTPDRMHLVGGELHADDWRPDLVYRHVFARRLNPASDFARACLEARRHRIFNPISSHLEAKGMLGLLSRAAAPDEGAFAAEVSLDEALREEVDRSVPWTRLLAHSAARGPDGRALGDLARTVAVEPARFVIKKSWDYGGRSVFLGAEHDDGAAGRAAEVLGAAAPLTWPDLVLAAAADEGDAWVVQEFVSASRRRHLVAGADGAHWKDLFVDLSVFTNLGVEERPRGGVTRAATRRIVNLQGGGGLAPLIRAEVIERLLAGR